MVDNAFGDVSASCELFSLLEQFTVLLYDKSSVLKSVNEARLELFCMKNRSMEYLPPTQVMCESLCLM